MLSRGIEYQVAHLVSTQKAHRLGGWCLSNVPLLLWQEYADIFGQDGRVVKASRHCEVLMLSRGIEYQVTHFVSTQKVHRLGGWCLSHVPSLLWQA